MIAQELRIGNLVNPNQTDEAFKVTSIETHDNLIGVANERTGAEKPIGAFRPIPLTEEWLLKFGFEKEGRNYHLWRNLYSTDAVKHTIIDFEYDATGESIRSFAFLYGEVMDGDIAYIKHVHQLQNLYFALTSQELKIKE